MTLKRSEAIVELVEGWEFEEKISMGREEGV
jgi:hypothetical protein